MQVTILSYIAHELYRRIDIATERDELVQLGEVGRLLEPLYDTAGLRGAGREFSLWAGLKIDSPEMGESYGEGIRMHYPELFS